MAVKKSGSAQKPKRSDKKVKKADDTDFSALDSAVSELAQQTAALLGEDKESKPKLPAKKSSAKSGPKTFDIVHPKQVGSQPAILKSSAPSQIKLQDTDEKLLESGTKNPEQADTAEVVADTKASATPKIVINHNPGSLKIASKNPHAEAESTDDKVQPSAKPTTAPDEQVKSSEEEGTFSTSPPDEKTSVLDGSEVEESVGVKVATPKASETPTKSDGKTVLSNPVVPAASETQKPGEDPDSTESKTPPVESESTNPQSAHDKPAATGSTHESEQSKPDLTSDGEKTEPSTKDDNDATHDGQLFSDNLDDKEVDGESGEDSTDIFDTEQYHPKLHDWSKLEHHNNAPILILIVLLAVLGFGMYVVLTGMRLPFVG